MTAAKMMKGLACLSFEGSSSVQLGAEAALWREGGREDGTQQILSICMTKWEITMMREPDSSHCSPP